MTVAEAFSSSIYLSMSKLIFLTKKKKENALSSSCSHFPLGNMLGEYLRG